MTEPLPCPFCGCEPSIEMTGFHLGARKIYCASDDCMGPHTTAANLEDATLQWNRRAALPPLRAREEIARNANGLMPCPFCGFEPQIISEGQHHSVQCTHYYCLANQIALQSKDKAIERWNSRSLLSSTAEQEWRDISQRIEDYVIGVVREVAELPDRTSPGYDGDMMMVTADELASILRCRFIDGDGNMMTSPLPGPPVAEPIVAEKSEVKS